MPTTKPTTPMLAISAVFTLEPPLFTQILSPRPQRVRAVRVAIFYPMRPACEGTCGGSLIDWVAPVPHPQLMEGRLAPRTTALGTNCCRRWFQLDYLTTSSDGLPGSVAHRRST